jgi:hypothetical protein
MKFELNHSLNDGEGMEEHSCHHMNNKNIKPGLTYSANTQQRVDKKSEVGPMSQPEPYAPLPDGLLEL